MISILQPQLRVSEPSSGASRSEVVQRLVGESLDARSEAVPVDVGAVDAAVRRLWVVLNSELDRARNVVAREYGRESQSGIDPGGNSGASEVAAVLDPALRHVGGHQTLEKAVVRPMGGRGTALHRSGAGEKE
jgi:hypothetical protein